MLIAWFLHPSYRAVPKCDLYVLYFVCPSSPWEDCLCIAVGKLTVLKNPVGKLPGACVGTLQGPRKRVICRNFAYASTQISEKEGGDLSNFRQHRYTVRAVYSLAVISVYGMGSISLLKGKVKVPLPAELIYIYITKLGNQGVRREMLFHGPSGAGYYCWHIIVSSKKQL